MAARDPFEAQPGDIIIPAAGMTEQTRSHLLYVLGEFDIPAASVGLQPAGPPADAPNMYGHLYEVVTGWQAANGPFIRTDRLEPVIPMVNTDTPVDALDEPVPMLALGSIRNALYNIERHPRSAPIRAGKLTINIGNAVADLQGERQYIDEGTAFLGSRPAGDGYRWDRPYWAITPAALYGLTQEDPNVGLGKHSRHRAAQVLDYVVQPPSVSSTI